MSSHRIQPLPAELAAIQAEMKTCAADFGLDFFPTIFEVVDYDQLSEIATATIILLPLAIWFWPDTTPSLNAWVMTAALGIACTAVAFVLYFRLIASVGPTKAITVTFLVPVFAVVMGALMLGEPITASMIVGGAIILLGTGMSTRYK